jgi:hypothetical protein
MEIFLFSSWARMGNEFLWKLSNINREVKKNGFLKNGFGAGSISPNFLTIEMKYDN